MLKGYTYVLITRGGFFSGYAIPWKKFRSRGSLKCLYFPRMLKSVELNICTIAKIRTMIITWYQKYMKLINNESNRIDNYGFGILGEIFIPNSWISGILPKIPGIKIFSQNPLRFLGSGSRRFIIPKRPQIINAITCTPKCKLNICIELLAHSEKKYHQVRYNLDNRDSILMSEKASDSSKMIPF